jgi:DNA modification methylase
MADIRCEDCRLELPHLPEHSVDAVITSPPYGVGKEYEEGGYGEWLALMYSVWPPLARVVKPGGFVAFVVADVRCHPDPLLPAVRASVIGRQIGVTADDMLAAAADGKGRSTREVAAALGVSEQTVDRRLLGNNARGGKSEPQTRVRLVGPDLVQAAAVAGFYLYDCRTWVKDPCWQTCEYHSGSYRAVDESEHVYIFARAGDVIRVDRDRLRPKEWADWGSRSVWHIPSVRANDRHPAMYPVQLAARLVRLLSPEGGVILDPFAGSGTTGVAAEGAGRKAILIEKDSGYCDRMSRPVDGDRKAGV